MKSDDPRVLARLAALAAAWTPPVVAQASDPGPDSGARVRQVRAVPPTRVALAGIVAVAAAATLGWAVLGRAASTPMVPEIQVWPATASGSAQAGTTPAASPQAVGSAPSSQLPTPSGGAGMVVVHVAGPVRHPGVVLLPAGSRVIDAVTAAGGLRRDADVGGTNLAALVSDGERVEVGSETTGQAGGATPMATSGATAVVLDLNTATAEQLDALPGIGPVTAAKILSWRAANGRFNSVDELTEVSGIGPRRMEELRAHVRV